MNKFSIKKLAAIIEAEPAENIAGSFTGVSTDSRTIKAGDCFFAISGENFDGADFLADAFAAGAACAVVNKRISSGDCLLKVDDTVQALGRFARDYRRHAGFKVIAITGSAGKTTTRQIAYHVLSKHFHCHQAPKNFNNNIGLPLTLLGAEPEDEIVIAELGSSSPGEIAYLTAIAQPVLAVITNVYPAHLAGFGDLQTIIREKLSIAAGLLQGGILLINGGFERLVQACRAAGIGFTTFGTAQDCNIRAEKVVCNGYESRFTVDGAEVYLPLAGPGNVENALAAWAICRGLGMEIGDFACAVKTVQPVPMRAEVLKIGRLTVINDCYNANPASMKNALDILANFSNKAHRRVFICGDMAELARQSRQLHVELGISIAQAGIHLLLAVGKFAKTVAEAAKSNSRPALQTKCFEDAASACNNLQKYIKDSDIVLVKGSRTAKLEAVIEKLKELFS
jgi:UDP-N-acetylmuramoyl-tripeptide--D-alanyl-D-alanine ligase